MSTLSTIDSLQALLGPAAAGSKDKAAASAAAAATGDQQNRFLSLLVAQMQNQDPLNPMDNAQLTTQLAQISTVDGIERLNATVKSLIGHFEGLQAVQGASLAGRQVLVEGSTLVLENGMAMGGFELAQPAERLTITIQDATGAALHKVDLGMHAAGLHSFEWDGQTDAGATAASGNYRFKIEALAKDSALSVTPLAAGRVEGVSRGTDGLTLNVRGIGTKSLDAVKQIM